MAKARTSLTNPLQIAEVAAPRGGTVGLTLCPGKRQSGAMTGAWARDLDIDLRAIRDWGAAIVVTLVTAEELRDLEVEGFGEAVAALGMAWLHLPIRDFSTPTPEWERRWSAERAAVHAELDRGGRVLIHCKGGLGRAGTIAARVLIERGLSAEAAIRAIRGVRPGAIETASQASYVKALSAAPEAPRRAIRPSPV